MTQRTRLLGPFSASDATTCSYPSGPMVHQCGGCCRRCHYCGSAGVALLLLVVVSKKYIAKKGRKNKIKNKT